MKTNRLASMTLLWLGALSMMFGQYLIAYRMGRESAAREIATSSDPGATARAIAWNGQ